MSSEQVLRARLALMHGCRANELLVLLLVRFKLTVSFLQRIQLHDRRLQRLVQLPLLLLLSGEYTLQEADFFERVVHLTENEQNESD